MVATESSNPAPAAAAIVAVGKAKSVLPKPDFKSIKQVDTQTRAIGLIQPPPDIRAIVDKTAQFVAKNGEKFEAQILQREQNNPKFNFLRTTDPYNAYYKHMVEQQKVGADGAAKPAAAVQPAQQAAAQQPQQTAVSVLPPKKAEPPEPPKYTVAVPEGLTYEVLDLIKLTAQHVARNGASFLTGLAAKEHANPQFYFLKPTHSLFGFFTALCDAYSRVLMPEKGMLARLRADAADRATILERCLRRLEFEKQSDAEAETAAAQAEAERMAMQSIDWHDFVVVETIEFDDEEDPELPLPLALKDVILLNKAGDASADAAAAPPADGEANGAEQVQMTDDERRMVAEANGEAPSMAPPAGGPPQEQPPAKPAVDGAPSFPAAPEPAPAAAPSAPRPTSAPATADDMDVDMEMEDAEEEPLRVVRDYKRPDTRPHGHDPSKFVISPITGELIPVDHMGEHMRVSLIDPRYQEQRNAMLAKIRDTTQASDEEIGRNLVGLAKKRPDVFGSTQEEVGALVTQTIQDARKGGSDRAVAWDGETRGPQLTGQLKGIIEQKAELGKRKQPEGNLPPPPKIGVAAPPVVVSAPRPLRQPPASQPLAAPARPPPPAQQQLPRPPPQAEQPTSLPPPPAASQPPAALPRPPAMPMPPPPGFPPPGFPMHHRPGMPPLPPPGMPGGPPSGAPPPGAPPDPKRQRMDFVLKPEEDFLALHDSYNKVLVQCPAFEGDANLTGQLMEVEVSSLSDSVGDLKARLAAVINTPANKLRMSREHVGFLTDGNSLAHYNIGPGVSLQLSVRGRKGK